MSNQLGPASLVGTLLLGFALLWAIRMVYGSRRVIIDDSLRLVLTIAGWILIYVGLFSIVGQVFLVTPATTFTLAPWLASVLLLSTIALGFMTVIFGMAVARFRELEWTSLMWMLAAAARKQIPLHEAARAFALERADEVGLRAARLADHLESGIPLPEAMRMARTHLPIDGLLAARFGTEMHTLSQSIATISRKNDELDSLIRGTGEKCFYLGLIVWVLLVQLSFIFFRIVPVFAQLFSEFNLTLPTTTQYLVDSSSTLGSFWPLWVMALLFFFVGSVFGVFYYLNWLPRNFPLMHRLTRRFDAALVMRALAAGIENDQPMTKIVWTLSRMFPRQRVRRRLERAGQRINNGEHWSDSLRKARLLSSSEANLLRVAERVGNLRWALLESSDALLRRISIRLRLFSSTIFPALILLLGGIIAVVVVGLFLPLVAMIQGLS